ncbi:UNC93-like protein MFSD11 [Paramacrobiotus metropolitanus]|uniref:UNC93-like protein MFSD11 n=1 Tax=Paramacrobiotus metropolitanus TaxID=2943436 RepID=UPI002445A8E9|nr:UNC93-like protein MFSD11 [Paramacrobiotus metropolitanus]XP_055342921.1 UNC93-like protein MFSD11 [Paramacrobiotus metropolitanus]
MKEEAPPPPYSDAVENHHDQDINHSVVVKQKDTHMHDAESQEKRLEDDHIPMLRDYQFWNVLAISISFMILFSAFHTCGMLQNSVLNDVHDEYFNGTGKEGYYSAAAIYTTMAVSNWIAPSMIAYTGPKYGMILGGIPYCLFMAVFLRPLYGTLYAASVLLGLGAAIIWTSQGVFLTINSTDKTMSRNAGMFWAILQLSNLWGNIFATIQLGQGSEISHQTRFILFIVLLVVAIVGVVMILMLRYPGARDRGKSAASVTQTSTRSARDWRKWAWILEIVASFKLLITRNMLLLAVTFAYTGFMLTFYSGVYGTAVHQTGQFGTEKNYLLGLNGTIIGIGEIVAGALFGFLGSRIHRLGRSLIVSIGVLMQLVSYLLIFLYFPAMSPLRVSSEATYIEPSKAVALSCAFMLGFGDASINIQIYALLGNMYAADSAPAFALFKFMQSFTAAIGFFYSSELTLPPQLAIVAAFGVAGAFTFVLVEWLTYRDFTRARQTNTTAISLTTIATADKFIKSQ